jgi:hypothetical protein
VNAVMELGVPYNAGSSLTSLGTVSVSRRAVLHAVIAGPGHNVVLDRPGPWAINGCSFVVLASKSPLYDIQLYFRTNTYSHQGTGVSRRI